MKRFCNWWVNIWFLSEEDISTSPSSRSLEHQERGIGHPHWGKELMGDAPDKVRHFLLDSFARRVSVWSKDPCKSHRRQRIGRVKERDCFDLAIMAIGIRLLPFFRIPAPHLGGGGGARQSIHFRACPTRNIFGTVGTVSVSRAFPAPSGGLCG